MLFLPQHQTKVERPWIMLRNLIILTTNHRRHYSTPLLAPCCHRSCILRDSILQIERWTTLLDSTQCPLPSTHLFWSKEWNIDPVEYLGKITVQVLNDASHTSLNFATLKNTVMLLSHSAWHELLSTEKTALQYSVLLHTSTTTRDHVLGWRLS